MTDSAASTRDLSAATDFVRSQAETSGTVVKFLADNKSMVTTGQVRPVRLSLADSALRSVLTAESVCSP